jgi:sugar phosphate isomerase/epimerase
MLMKISVQNGGIIEHIGAEKCYAAIRDAGFTAIDWNLDHGLPSADIKGLTYENVSIFQRPIAEVIAHYTPELEIMRKNGLTVTQAHAPFPAYVPGHPEVLEFMIGIYKSCIRLCHHAGCRNLVVHGISLEETDFTNTPDSIAAMNQHLYESLIPTLLECDVIVCLENLFTKRATVVEGACSDAQEAAGFIDALNAKAGREVFGFCLDVGHLQLLSKNLRTYIPVLGKRIKALHIHDNDGLADLHLAPMTGTVNWVVFCDCLKQIGYDGDLSFETFRQTRLAWKFDEELIAPWLNLIRATGESFRKRIQN